MDGGLLARRVNLLGPHLRQRFGGPVVKIPLETGLGCPNRDGSLGHGGCAWCPPGASGRGRAGDGIAGQLGRGLASLEARAARHGRQPPRALAYYQSFTSTHAPAQELAALLEPALACPGLAGIIVSTRPDCLDPPRWRVLGQAAARLPLWLELGLQSAHDATLAALNRGHDLACFDAAVAQAAQQGLPVVAHVILGLPGEDPSHTAATARHLAELGLWGVKMHQLMVLEGAPLAHAYREGSFQPWSLVTWAQAAAEFLAWLPRRMVIHRLVADPGADRLLGPEWAGRKDLALQALADYMIGHNLVQGCWRP